MINNTNLESSDERGSVLLILTVVMIAVMFSFLGSNFYNDKAILSKSINEQKTTITNLNNIKNALISYVRINNKLPCPSSDEAGISQCQGSEFMGLVPWKELGLKAANVYDGWGRLITYAVDRNHTLPSVANAEIAIIQDLASIPSEAKAFVLISHGINGLGAYNVSGLGESENDLEKKNALNTAMSFAGKESLFVENLSIDDILVHYSIANLFNEDDEEEEYVEGADVTFSDDSIARFISIAKNLPKNGTSLPPVIVNNPDGSNQLEFGDSYGDYVSCFWWPNLLRLLPQNPNTKNISRAYYEFSLPTNKSGMNDGRQYGFMLTFLPASSFPPSIQGRTNQLKTTCGDSGINMGYTNSGKERLPNPKFAVEVDIHKSTNFEPNYNHFAVVRNNHSHNNELASDDNGALCVASTPSGPYNKQPENRGSAPAYGCFNGGLLTVPNFNWLEKGSEFWHQVRVEIHYNTEVSLAANCPADALFVKAWIWEDSIERCTSCRNLTTNYSGGEVLPTAIIQDCRTKYPPISGSLFDPEDLEQAIFGFIYSTNNSETNPSSYANGIAIRHFGINSSQY